jgi:hypothetical protein
MSWAIAKVLIAGVIISFTSWLAGKRPGLAGFIMALPISTMIALLFTYSEYRDPVKAAAFAKSIFLAIPLSLLFFVPFLLSDQLKLSFAAMYSSGVLLIAAGYFAHRMIMGS